MRLLVALAFTLLLPGGLCAQVPVFSPPDRPSEPPAPRPKETGGKGQGDPTKAGSKNEDAPTDPIAALIGRLNRWPAPKSKEASLILAGLGSEAKAQLLRGLSDNDWRIQAGCAFALAEMGEKDALPTLKAALADPSNRASAGEIMRALVRLDPVSGAQAILPFLAHSSARVRLAARDALPARLSPEFLPEVLALHSNPRGPVRVTALELLQRLDGGPEREEWFSSLADPEPEVAMTASRVLGKRPAGQTSERLLTVAAKSPMRPAAYAMLSLAQGEDQHGVSLIEERSEVSARAQKFLRSEDTFYRGTGAIVLSNLAYRSDDAALHRLADTVLVPVLLSSVTGGTYYSDYASLEDLCWRKLELLSGKGFGQNGQAWKSWWAASEQGFVARRELRSLDASTFENARILLSRVDTNGESRQFLLTGSRTDPDLGLPEGPLFVPASLSERLLAAMKETRLFSGRGETQDPARLDASLKIVVHIKSSSSQFSRFHYEPVPAELLPFEAVVAELEQSLVWQRFVHGESPEARRQSIADLGERFASDERSEVKTARIADLALERFSSVNAAIRRHAVSAFKAAPASWRDSRRDEFTRLLSSEKQVTNETLLVLEFLGRDLTPAQRDAALELLSSGTSRRAGEALSEFVQRLEKPVIVGLMTDARQKVRAAAAAALSQFKDDVEVANLLIVGLNDEESLVRAASLKSLSNFGDERTIALLESVLQSEDQTLKHRAIHALGVVGQEQAVPRLMEIYRSGDRRVQFTVVRALREASGRRGEVALTSIVRESGEAEIRREALDALIESSSPGASESLSEILTKTPEPEIQSLALGGLAKHQGLAAMPQILPFFEAKDESLSRVAVLTAARLGAKEALEPMLKRLESAIAGDVSLERALESLTFHCPEHPSPPRRLESHKIWARNHASDDRASWLRTAALEREIPLDETLDWLGEKKLPTTALRTLVILLETGNRALRSYADGRLRQHYPKELSALPQVATETEVTERAALFKDWLETQRR